MTDPLPPQHPPVPPPPERSGRESDARMWAAFAHLAGLASLIGIPGVLGSVVVWLWKRDTHPLVAEHGREAVNFQLSLLIYNVAIAVIAFLTCGLGALLVPVVLVVAVLLPVLATLKASEGLAYRYPFTMRLI